MKVLKSPQGLEKNTNTKRVSAGLIHYTSYKLHAWTAAREQRQILSTRNEEYWKGTASLKTPYWKRDRIKTGLRGRRDGQDPKD